MTPTRCERCARPGLELALDIYNSTVRTGVRLGQITVPGRCGNTPRRGHHLLGGDDVAERTCSIEGCERKHYGRGWCHAHYERWRKTGSPIPPPRPLCAVEGCQEPFYALGWCNLHWNRQRATGTTDLIHPPSFEERFWANVDYNGPLSDAAPDLGPCWLWTGYIKDTGYGGVNGRRGDGGKTVYLAHRVAFHLLVGSIPDGYELDHLCRVRVCCRPSHLEAVTPRVNNLRSDSIAAQHARQTHCKRGHEFTPENTYTPPTNPGRQCRECIKIRWRRQETKRQALRAAS